MEKDLFAGVNQALDELLREIRRADPQPFTGGAVAINRDQRGNVRVSYRATHYLTNPDAVKTESR